jgi:hypothetical protein
MSVQAMSVHIILDALFRQSKVDSGKSQIRRNYRCINLRGDKIRQMADYDELLSTRARVYTESDLKEW